ncbi:MAG: hypothetical protein AOA66_1293 [Candidatus Bathyarchaeota archaeon BA2]|nr:MAG: hypothetical protein AOA66_1293 [Candidatus Bathyarchaeota archaeon BA2]
MKTCLPPIGSFEEGQVLFVGTNPRCDPSKNDEIFYRYALRSFDNFLQFSKDGKYKDLMGNERFLFDDPHYNIHQACLATISGSWKLGDRSSVAELFMCGSKDANVFYMGYNLYKKYDLALYICAQEYLNRYIKLVKPKIIVSYGWVAMQWFQVKFAEELRENMSSLYNGVPRKYEGHSTRDTIEKLHGRFSQITFKGEHESTLILSLHPNARNFKFKQEELLKTFHFVARSVGF